MNEYCAVASLITQNLSYFSNLNFSISTCNPENGIMHTKILGGVNCRSRGFFMEKIRHLQGYYAHMRIFWSDRADFRTRDL